jgi:outer membrane protein assembly factor BamB
MSNPNPHNLQVLRGLTTSRSLLSGASNSAALDLSSTDDGSGRQKWNVTLVAGYKDVYHIMVVGGTESGYVYLSCTSDGNTVDLYTRDDGSGRQRWQIEPIDSNIPQYARIKVYGGMSNPNRYLSSAADGSKLTLVSADTGTGLERWQIQ